MSKLRSRSTLSLGRLPARPAAGLGELIHLKLPRPTARTLAQRLAACRDPLEVIVDRVMHDARYLPDEPRLRTSTPIGLSMPKAKIRPMQPTAGSIGKRKLARKAA
jgi:hypothetical protein